MTPASHRLRRAIQAPAAPGHRGIQEGAGGIGLGHGFEFPGLDARAESLGDRLGGHPQTLTAEPQHVAGLCVPFCVEPLPEAGPGA